MWSSQRARLWKVELGTYTTTHVRIHCVTSTNKQCHFAFAKTRHRPSSRQKLLVCGRTDELWDFLLTFSATPRSALPSTPNTLTPISTREASCTSQYRPLPLWRLTLDPRSHHILSPLAVGTRPFVTNKVRYRGAISFSDLKEIPRGWGALLCQCWKCARVMVWCVTVDVRCSLAFSTWQVFCHKVPEGGR
jgi:hypothetical protein